jgi:hypothetical protein
MLYMCYGHFKSTLIICYTDHIIGIEGFIHNICFVDSCQPFKTIYIFFLMHLSSNLDLPFQFENLFDLVKEATLSKLWK